MTNKKSIFIEQLRGIAILLVLIYHYVNRVPHEIMGSEYAPSLEFFTGKIGVYIFFVLSGYLIAKSVEKCVTVGEFYAKRISRIWPLFIFANIVIFSWTFFLEPPVSTIETKPFDASGRTIYDLFGSILFLKDFGFKWVDGAFWSILVELKYYFLLGGFAFFFKDKFIDKFLWFSVLLGSIDFTLFVFFSGGEYTIVNKILHGVLIAQYLPFFAVGMTIFSRKYDLLFGACCFLCFAQIMQAASLNPDFTVQGTLEFSVIFVIFLIIDWILFKGKICSFWGKYSYSIYLFHQVIGLSIIAALIPYIGINFAILAATSLVLVISVTASWMVEWRYRKQCTALLIKAGSLVKLDKLKLNLDITK